ncbi:MAG: hypothetical protein U9Q22_02460 [Candidatus Altiarchaeota archaeon]|nr:hypothetical protein [Candidatus Altiarchaeota archaeon]
MAHLKGVYHIIVKMILRKEKKCLSEISGKIKFTEDELKNIDALKAVDELIVKRPGAKIFSYDADFKKFTDVERV